MAGSDYRMLRTGVTPIADYMRLEDEFRMKKAQVEQENALKQAQIHKLMQEAASGGESPSTVREWQFYNQLPQEDQRRFLQMKRADQIMNLGGQMSVYNPLEGGIKESFPVTLKPEDTPDVRGAQAAAKTAGEQGRLGGVPLSPAQIKRDEETIKADTKRMQDLHDVSSNAQIAKDVANQMQAYQSDLGYTGIGAAPLNWVDKALTPMGAGGLIKGSPKAREGFKASSVQQWVQLTLPLKGALSDKEGARFNQGIPSLDMSSGGIALMNDLTIKMSQRAQEKSQFYEDYYAKNGSLQGADKIWNDYADANPILPQGFGENPAQPSNVNLKRGAIEDGYFFNGGDPADPKNWTKVK